MANLPVRLKSTICAGAAATVAIRRRFTLHLRYRDDWEWKKLSPFGDNNAAVMARYRQVILGFALLEHRRLEAVSLKQLVELGPIAFGELGGLRDVAAGDLEQARQVVALKGLARFLE